MPNKPASLFLLVPKNDDAEMTFWRPFINRLEEGTYTEQEAASTLVLGLQAKNYDLIDHQFVRVTLNVQFPKMGKSEMVILLPRHRVLVIIEGKSHPIFEGFKGH